MKPEFFLLLLPSWNYNNSEGIIAYIAYLYFEHPTAKDEHSFLFIFESKHDVDEFLKCIIAVSIFRNEHPQINNSPDPKYLQLAQKEHPDMFCATYTEYEVRNGVPF